MSFKISGELEIHDLTGVIYFHSNDGKTLLRIQNLPIPITKPIGTKTLDINFSEHLTSWSKLDNVGIFPTNTE